MADTGTCRSCGLPILWVEMAVSGKKNPLNPEPTPDGNVAVVGGVGEALKGEALGEARKNGADLYLSHFATCKTAAQHRKPK